jgi:diaminohydroxyphosphoribosylaminopyrimidine deaminase/5-amino-6-(5-phosphoribosylamino)uracil reductase
MMTRALELARRGLGLVEPNPQVGAVVVDDRGTVIGEGWHQRYGGPHAEIHALAAAGTAARGGTLYVTLEPCCHVGKTPPCSRAVIASGIRRVVIGAEDPVDHGSGRGIDVLQAAGLEVQTGVLADPARRLISPFLRLMTTGIPWVHAKWAMTLDGKIATHTGSSKWISNETSRGVVHQLRGRMDGIVTGIGTVLADDPLLTARPPGHRTAARIVVDTMARLPLHSKLVQSTSDAPVILIISDQAPGERIERLQQAGVEVLAIPCGPNGRPCPVELMEELGRRRMTNVLIEAGSHLMGSLLDAGLLSELHAFIAPRLSGGSAAPSPIGGTGVKLMHDAFCLKSPEVRILDGDIYVHGDVVAPALLK